MFKLLFDIVLKIYTIVHCFSTEIVQATVTFDYDVSNKDIRKGTADYNTTKDYFETAVSSLNLSAIELIV